MLIFVMAECHWRVRPGRNKRILAIISHIHLDPDCEDTLVIRKTGQSLGQAVA